MALFYHKKRPRGQTPWPDNALLQFCLVSVQSLFRKVLEEISSVAFEIDETLCLCDGILGSQDLVLILAAELVLYLALCSELSDGDPDRDTDEVCVIELDSRSLVTVVHHYLYAH